MYHNVSRGRETKARRSGSVFRAEMQQNGTSRRGGVCEMTFVAVRIMQSALQRRVIRQERGGTTMRPTRRALGNSDGICANSSDENAMDSLLLFVPYTLSGSSRTRRWRLESSAFPTYELPLGNLRGESRARERERVLSLRECVRVSVGSHTCVSAVGPPSVARAPNDRYFRSHVRSTKVSIAGRPLVPINSARYSRILFRLYSRSECATAVLRAFCCVSLLKRMTLVIRTMRLFADSDASRREKKVAHRRYQ